MQYKDIKTINEYKNGTWFTFFYKDDDVIKIVEWKDKFNSDDVKRVIDNEIVKFI